MDTRVRIKLLVQQINEYKQQNIFENMFVLPTYVYIKCKLLLPIHWLLCFDLDQKYKKLFLITFYISCRHT